jgi:L-cysteine S-thiosulfotransferase
VRPRLGAVALLLGVALAATAAAQERPLPLTALRSGIEFAGADVRALQADDAGNPGFLWVERGERLWKEGERSCASCHADARTSMRGVAARYPAHDARSGAVMDLDARIMECRARRQQAPPWTRESEDLLAVSSFVSLQSRGMPLAVSIAGPARESFERGRRFYYQRHGQMNVSCAQCHEQSYGKRLFAETISQGHGTAFPAYRLEWQAVGSLQRRLRACLFGVRAEMPPPGAPELADLELFLAWRAQGLPLEAPGVRR